MDFIEYSTIISTQEFISARESIGGSITIPLTSCLIGLDQSVLQIKTKIVSCHTADSKPVKQVNSTVILPPLVFPVSAFHGAGMVLSFYFNLIIQFLIY